MDNLGSLKHHLPLAANGMIVQQQQQQHHLQQQQQQQQHHQQEQQEQEALMLHHKQLQHEQQLQMHQQQLLNMRANNARFNSVSSVGLANGINGVTSQLQKQQQQQQQGNVTNFAPNSNNNNNNTSTQNMQMMMRLRSYSVSSNTSDGLAHNSPRSSTQNSPLEPTLYNSASSQVALSLNSNYFNSAYQADCFTQNFQQQQLQALQNTIHQPQNMSQSTNSALRQIVSLGLANNFVKPNNGASAMQQHSTLLNTQQHQSIQQQPQQQLTRDNSTSYPATNNVQRVSLGSIFSRRTDYTPFDALPRHKINSYHIKMEDDGSHGNDEVRWFILSNLSANKMNKACCIFCQKSLTIYDRYPLLEGTFFLSPIQHHKQVACVRTESLSSGGSLSNKGAANKRSDSMSNSFQRSSSVTGSSTPTSVNTTNGATNVSPDCSKPTRRMGGPATALVAAEAAAKQQEAASNQNGNNSQYINCICMGCLEGWTGQIRCKFCDKQWIGSHLIVGSMYSFDIFAAQPCCRARLQCNNCSQLVKMTSNSANQTQSNCRKSSNSKTCNSETWDYFSHYSQKFRCKNCQALDYHFVKPVSSIYNFV